MPFGVNSVRSCGVAPVAVRSAIYEIAAQADKRAVLADQIEWNWGYGKALLNPRFIVVPLIRARRLVHRVDKQRPENRQRQRRPPTIVLIFILRFLHSHTATLAEVKK